MAWLARLAALLGGKTTQANIVIIGLPHCGKSTIMHQLKPRHEPMVNLTPTIPIGCNAEKFQWRSLTFVAFDLGEQLAGFGNPWEDFYRDCHGIIFVFDSSDRVNMAAAKVQLELVLRNPYIVGRDIPLMLFANKADQPAAISSYQCVDFFSLRNCEKHWNVFSTDALTGEGFNEALDWFAHQLRTRRPIPGLLDQR